MSVPLITASGSETRRVFTTHFGTFTFEKRDGAARSLPFGQRMVLILPKHGDLVCPCNSCSAYRLVLKEEADGWKLIDFFESALSKREEESTTFTVPKEESKEEREERQRMAPVRLEQRLLDIAQIRDTTGEMLAETDLSNIFEQYTIPMAPLKK